MLWRVDLCNAPSVFTYCTSVRLSFPLPSVTERQHYFVRTRLQRLSHFTAWTLSKGGISESKCSSLYWKLCTCIHKWEEGREKTSLKTNLCSSCGEGQNSLQGLVRFQITTHRNDQFPVRLPRQFFLSHMSQSLFTTYTCKTQKRVCRDTLLHFSKFPVALLLKKYFTTESNWDKILASLWILCV